MTHEPEFCTCPKPMPSKHSRLVCILCDLPIEPAEPKHIGIGINDQLEFSEGLK